MEEDFKKALAELIATSDFKISRTPEAAAEYLLEVIKEELVEEEEDDSHWACSDGWNDSVCSFE